MDTQIHTHTQTNTCIYRYTIMHTTTQVKTYIYSCCTKLTHIPMSILITVGRCPESDGGPNIAFHLNVQLTLSATIIKPIEPIDW